MPGNGKGKKMLLLSDKTESGCKRTLKDITISTLLHTFV